MVQKWLALRDDPSSLSTGMVYINRYIKQASVEEENAYYIALHLEYMK